jgi:hypothetical protein
MNISPEQQALINDPRGRAPTQLVGQRVKKDGSTETTYMAAQALSDLHVGNPAEPMFTYYNKGIIMGQNLPKNEEPNCSVDGAGFEFAYTIDPSERKKVSFNYTLKNSVKAGEKPIVFLVASPLPHAMIYVINNGILYTIGFGYNDETGRQKLSKKLIEKGQDALAHSIETINGALYTADYLMPEATQAGKIAWVGFLDMDTVNRIERLLNQTTAIIYTGVITANGSYKISNKCTLMVPQQYCEAAHFISRSATNCITWAQTMLNTRIDCGWLGNPKYCKPVTEDEWKDIKDNMNNPRELDATIKEIQNRLRVPNICTRISKKLGLCGGMSRRRKNKYKNKNKHKKTNKKIKRVKRKH